MASDSSVMAVIRASRPTFRNHHDKLAFAIHATFLAAGFSLTAVGRTALDNNPPTEGEEVGIEGWNELDDAYGFVYSKSEKGSKRAILVKCLPLEDYLMVDSVELINEQKDPFHLQINTKDYLTEDAGQQTSYVDMYKNLEGLVKSLSTDILEKLEPKGLVRSLTKDLQIPLFITNQCLLGPGAGFFPQRSSGVGGGMLVGPNDPRFFGPGVSPGSFGGIPGVPPGARFDPYGPPDVPGFEPARFVRQPRHPGGGTHPDLEHFQGSDYI